MTDVESPSWARDAIFYQIFPDRFRSSERVAKPKGLEPWEAPPTLFGFKGGDLDGVRERLDYLADLGFNALYLNPIFASTANHRYHTHDYFRVDPILGGDGAFARLLDDAHARGIKVVLDGVFNHASRGFYQFNHTLENGAASPYVDWFHFNRDWLASGRALNAYAIDTERHYFAPTIETSLGLYGYRSWWDIPALPKFNTGNPEVREYLFSVAEHWIRAGADGWRLDVPQEIDDDDFWREFRRRVRAVNPEAYIVGEIWEDASRWLQGDQFDGVTNYLLARVILGFALGPSLNRVELDRCGLRDAHPLSATDCGRALVDLAHRYPHAATERQLNMLGGHDTPRILTSGSGDTAGVKLAFTLMFVFPGAPCVYYGDEIGMAGGHDPDCRRGFDWDERLWDKDMQAHIRALAWARRDSDALRRGELGVVLAKDQVLVLKRQCKGDLAVAALNASTEACQVAVPWQGDAVDVLTGKRVVNDGNGKLLLALPARSAVIVRPL